MTDYPTRRAAREAEARAARRPHQHHPRTHNHHVVPHLTPRSKATVGMASVAALLLAGSALIATPANAATTQGQAIYASQLLDSTQVFTVGSDVSKATVQIDPYDTSAPSAASVAAAPADSKVTFTVSGQTNADWAALVLQDASLPLTKNNITVMLQWMDSENSPQDWWLRNNPLNNGLGSGGGAGFGSYDNLNTAASYVAQQLDRSLFSGIRAALAADSDPSVTASAIEASAWAGSHYGYGSLWHAVDVQIVEAPASAW